MEVKKLRAKPVQLMTCSNKLYALLSDGSIWSYDRNKWELVSEVVKVIKKREGKYNEKTLVFE